MDGYLVPIIPTENPKPIKRFRWKRSLIELNGKFEPKYRHDISGLLMQSYSEVNSHFCTCISRCGQNAPHEWSFDSKLLNFGRLSSGNGRSCGRVGRTCGGAAVLWCLFCVCCSCGGVRSIVLVVLEFGTSVPGFWDLGIQLRSDFL
ncbi:hypothetical protein TEA_028980 [Camellia sinensis var. sinensis]|uniref:Uncharacterized protein n=1 Tax=Camellia sinensis var. sinensis TaxID=542762 RepID=A0A4V3WN29_CAMSN|nr:hypothetical protein TEA_028980 [Camellia sinensis var. sinensis]